MLIGACDPMLCPVLHFRPVVLRGAAKDWKLREKWTKKMFLEYDAMIGGAGVKVGKIPYGPLYGNFDIVYNIAR